MKEKVLKYKFTEKGDLDIAGFIVPRIKLQQFTLFLQEIVYPDYIIRYEEK